MKRIALLLVLLACIILVSGCVRMGYPDEKAIKSEALSIVSDIIPPDVSGYNNNHGKQYIYSETVVKVVGYDSVTGEAIIRISAIYLDTPWHTGDDVLTLTRQEELVVPAGYYKPANPWYEHHTKMSLAELRKYHDELGWSR